MMQIDSESLRILAEMGEWMAYGFYEVIDMPWPRSFGRAFLRLYENMDIGPSEHRLLLPIDPFPSLRTQGSHGAHHATGFICDFMHHCGIHVNEEMVAEKKSQFPQYAAFIDDLAADLQGRLPHFGGYTHANPDIDRVVTVGFDAMERELDQQIAAVEKQGAAIQMEEYNLLAALKEYASGVRTFHARTADALNQAASLASGQRQAELSLIASSFASCFLTPATTFVQGMLAVHFAWLLDGCDSIGRVDQALGALFEADIHSGALSLEFARRLIDELFADMERLNGWNLQIGGYQPDGGEGYNGLTRELILACGRNKFRRPNVAFLVTERNSSEGLSVALQVLREGSGRPALYNTDLYVQTLQHMDLGLTLDDARQVGFGGCTETMIAGMSNVGSLEGDLNLAKALELALHDGCDPLTGQQSGPHTGAFVQFPDFPAFLSAVKRQIQYMTDAFVATSRAAIQNRFKQGDPKLYRTFFTRDCVRQRRSFEAGGARYNWAVVNYPGIANLIDSLAAVKKCVYEDLSISPNELIDALQADFQGFESVRQKLASVPKFGNDEWTVDDLAREILTYAWQELYTHSTPRGGRYLASCILFSTYGIFGAQVGALPDGRRARTVLADSTGPAQGRDTHGPTAMLKSVSRLPLSLAAGTPILNIRFQKQILNTDSGLEACAGLVRTYFALGGMQIQFSVISKQEMLAAQIEPENYRDLIVRIGGFSEYFTSLDRALQDSVIARTDHGL
jgi:trans-4-hydroxy-L-proline dehydratase